MAEDVDQHDGNNEKALLKTQDNKEATGHKEVELKVEMEEIDLLEQKSAKESRIKRGLDFFWSDFRRGRLAWVKVVFFLQTAGLVTLYPYLTIHMR